MIRQLSPEAEKLKAALLEQFTFEDEASLSILDTALEAFDLFHAAQAQVDIEGLTVTGDRGQIKAHPLLAVIRDQRAQFFAGLKLLKLDITAEEQNPVGRPGVYKEWARRNK